MAGWYGARLLILATGVVLTLIGFALIAGGPTLAPTGIWPTVIGLALIVGAIIEKARYRSDEAERNAAPHGPGGGEPVEVTLEPRFRPTDERFEDPTTRRRMRVWVDPTSGERRYRAED
jgi:uncharacterized protein (DUF58 family)